MDHFEETTGDSIQGLVNFLVNWTSTTRCPLQTACLVQLCAQALNTLQFLRGVKINGTVYVSATQNRWGLWNGPRGKFYLFSFTEVRNPFPPAYPQSLPE